MFVWKIKEIKKKKKEEEDSFTESIKAIVEHFPPSEMQWKFIDSRFQRIYLKYKGIAERKEQPLQIIRSRFLRELLYSLESYLIGDEGIKQVSSIYMSYMSGDEGIKQVSSIMSYMSGSDQDELSNFDLDELCAELDDSKES